MPPTAEIEFNNSSCLINCSGDCSCAVKNEQSIIKNPEFSSDVNEIIAKGQNDLATALRSLRWSKSKTILFNSDKTVINEEKCRPIISLKEVAEHDSCGDCWIILYDRVYDVTNFLNEVNINIIMKKHIELKFCIFEMTRQFINELNFHCSIQAEVM